MLPDSVFSCIFVAQMLLKQQICCPNSTKFTSGEFLHHAAPHSYKQHHLATRMNTRIQIPKHCQLCGQAFVAQTTTTRYCGDNCSKRAYKLRKKEEKIQQALSEQINTANEVKPQTLQSLQTLQPVFNLKNKEFLSVQEAADLLGASRWTIQRLVQRNVLNAAKLGRRTILKRSEIDNLFKTDGK